MNDGVLHPVVMAAAEGRLPQWAVAGEARRAHVARVRALMGEWADALALPDVDRARWRAAGLLHDALREEDPDQLRPGVPPTLRDLPPALLHGPAAARRLWVEGVRDGELLQAVAYHTVGHPSLGTLGRAAYAADFLEPGRDLLNEWRASLRGRMPHDLDRVVREVAGARIRHRVDGGSVVRPETMAFWNVLAGEAG